MYRQPSGQLRIEDFVLPFEGRLNPGNRWVKLSKLIPWEGIEKIMHSFFYRTQEPKPNPFGWRWVFRLYHTG